MDNKNGVEEKGYEYVSMYVMFAKLFAYMSKEIIDRFGEEGEEAIKKAVQLFGEERGRDIARRAFAKGAKNDVENYLASYDMGRSDHFEYEDTYGEDQVEQVFTRCIFADQWTKDGMEKYGALYCEIIDAAIAKGYNENFECIHDKHFFKDGICHFCFKMNK